MFMGGPSERPIKEGEIEIDCPFCGHEPKLWYDGERWFLTCENCEIRGPLLRIRSRAIDHWNRRFYQ